MNRRMIAAATGGLLAVAVLAACGGSGSEGSGQADGESDALPTNVTAAASDGEYAQHLVDRIIAGVSKPLKAEGEPIAIGYTGTENDPALSQPEARLGTEAAVKYINDVLGGVGADPAAGKPGRPLELVTCTHTLNSAEAVACANQIAQAKPAAIFLGVDPMTSVMLPAWKGIPVINPVPIAPQDLAQDGEFNFGLGVLLGVGVTQLGLEQVAETTTKRYADVFTPNGGSAEYANSIDVQTADVLAPSHPGVTFKSFSIPAGTADVSPLVQNLMSFKPDSIYISANTTGLGQIFAGLQQAGYSGHILAAYANLNPSLLSQYDEFLTKTQADFYVSNYVAYAADIYKSLPVPYLELKAALMILKDYDDTPASNWAEVGPFQRDDRLQLDGRCCRRRQGGQ